jgi:hypothetical protein
VRQPFGFSPARSRLARVVIKSLLPLHLLFSVIYIHFLSATPAALAADAIFYPTLGPASEATTSGDEPISGPNNTVKPAQTSSAAEMGNSPAPQIFRALTTAAMSTKRIRMCLKGL